MKKSVSLLSAWLLCILPVHLLACRLKGGQQHLRNPHPHDTIHMHTFALDTLPPQPYAHRHILFTAAAA